MCILLLPLFAVRLCVCLWVFNLFISIQFVRFTFLFDVYPAKCSNDVSPTSNYIWDNENQIERISSSGTVEDESSSTPSAGDFFVDDDALVDARIDGKIGVRANNSIIQTRANAADANSNDSAFNFISTQSEPITRSSFTRTHDPVVSTELIAPRMATKCTVVQGHITLYTYDHDSYENIEVRAIDAIKQYMEDDTFVKQNLLNDVVLGVKFAGSPGYVTNRFGTPVSSTLGSDAPDVFTAPVMILIALGAILCVLVALFVGTSTRKKRKRYDSSYHNRDIVTKPHDKMSKDEQDVTMTSSNQSIDEKDATMTSSKSDCDFFYSSYTQLFEGIGSACSKRFSGFSNEAPTNIDDGPVYNETYETTANGNGGVRIHGVRSNADEKYEDYYDHDEAPPETNGLASLDSLRRPTTPGKKKKTPRRDYPSQSRVFSSPRFSRRSNDYDMFSDRAILRYDDELDERPGIEISLDQKSRLLRH